MVNSELATEEKEEKMVLAHSPVPPYRRVFHGVLFLAVIYLAAIFTWSLM
jgi:hypothetical protein